MELAPINVTAEQVVRGECTLDTLAQLADDGLRLQNQSARLRVLAERQIADQYLADPHQGETHRTHLIERGWSRYRLQKAERFVQLNLAELDDYFADHVATGREGTRDGALKLLPSGGRAESKQLRAFDNYVAPSVEAAIARRVSADLSEALWEFVADTINTAIHVPPGTFCEGFKWTHPHVYVYTMVMGIKDDGTLGDQWTFESIATKMGCTPQHVRNLWFQAKSWVGVPSRMCQSSLSALEILATE
jgi:hypothetical protein